MTPYQQHLTKWAGCTKCRLCSGRKRMVFFRGSVPCDVLFVGEAPGVSEDVLGRPFVGPAGKLLDDIIREAWMDSKLTWGMTNLVCCFPKEEKRAGVNEPPVEAIRACQTRLAEIVQICEPNLVVQVGKLSEKWCHEDPRYKTLAITHPSAILKCKNPVQKPLMVKQCIVKIRSAIEEI